MSGKSTMYGGGESYSGVVPTKQPNKGGRPSAEVVEGRPLTKENAEQPTPCRTPSRESGPSGLDHVRQVFSWRGNTSEVRTVCVSSASTDPCGGCRATGIPTAPPLIGLPGPRPTPSSALRGSPGADLLGEQRDEGVPRGPRGSAPLLMPPVNYVHIR